MLEKIRDFLPSWSRPYLVILAGLSFNLCSPASSAERLICQYTDANRAAGCFALVSGKDWLEITGSGEQLSFQETARDGDTIELFDSSRGCIDQMRRNSTGAAGNVVTNY